MSRRPAVQTTRDPGLVKVSVPRGSGLQRGEGEEEWNEHLVDSDDEEWGERSEFKLDFGVVHQIQADQPALDEVGRDLKPTGQGAEGDGMPL